MPDRIGRYAIREFLGMGAMGMVYRAHDPVLDRDVALKTLRGTTDSEWVQRFQREARSAAKMRHPGIVPVHELGESGDVVFFTMDLIEGKSFAAALWDGGLSAQAGCSGRLPRLPASPEERAQRLPSTLDVLASVAEALGYAHEQGIVHRDVKPQNILLDRAGRPYLTDFGLAKDASGISSMTEDGAQMGTPWYMSPEQARGRARDATPASDVFSMGVILYELLTGCFPFDGESRFELYEAIIRATPRRPSEVAPTAPAEVERICLKALEKDPANRYPTARELARDLRQYLKASRREESDIPVIELLIAEEIEAAERDGGRSWRISRYLAVGSMLAILLGTLVFWRPWRAASQGEGQRDSERGVDRHNPGAVVSEPSVEAEFKDARDSEQKLVVRDSASIRLVIEKYQRVQERGAGTGYDARAKVALARLQEELNKVEEAECASLQTKAQDIRKRLESGNLCKCELCEGYRGIVKPGSEVSTALLQHLQTQAQEELHRRGELLGTLDAIATEFGRKAPKSKFFKDLEDSIGYLRSPKFEPEVVALEKAAHDPSKPLVDFLLACKDPWWQQWGVQHGLIETSESAVLLALKWLARHQSPDGCWKGAGFVDQCTGAKCDGVGANDYDAGLTGLSVLAFLGAGYTHLSREEVYDDITGKDVKLGEVVKKAIRWLVNNQDADGCIGPRVSRMMYNHAICALALSEAYGMSESPILKEPAQKAVDFLVQAKNPHMAWGYTPKCGDNDSSVTGWCVMALKSAELSNLSVGHSLLVEARGWFDSVTDKDYGKCGYRRLDGAGAKAVYPGKSGDYAPHESLAAVGMVVRTFVDHDRHDPMLELEAKLLVQDLPVWDDARKTKDYDYWQWGTLALFQFDGPGSGGSGKYWQGWNKAVIGALVKNQKTKESGCADGSWDANDRWGFEGGRVYATAINALTMEVYYRYANAFGVSARPK